ncbi:MAG: 50S ribosomal protein L11 methyltransferase [Alphaproteobacteria bacterium]|nr:50S ribosomal protein L11 methyltransferase [Alphaproteobacteria bacterium]
MSNNAGSCLIVKFSAADYISDELENFAEDFFDVYSIDYQDDGKSILVGYMPTSSSEKKLLSAAEKASINLPEYEIKELKSENWLTENVIKFAPVETKDFVVYGIHEKEIDTKGKIGVKVYAATAFGSEHQTTKSCLEAIADIDNFLPNVKNVLDVGTGSGVLAIAAAKLWKNAHIVAVDIDDESVIVAGQNAEDNGVEKQITVAYSDGYSSEVVKKSTPYDVIFANILARPLIAMAQDMAKNLKKGGFSVISGFIDEQVDWVVGEHEKFGLKCKKIYELDNWRAALLEKI